VDVVGRGVFDALGSSCRCTVLLDVGDVLIGGVVLVLVVVGVIVD